MNLYHTGLSELYRKIEALDDQLTGISDPHSHDENTSSSTNVKKKVLVATLS
ncbi:MAG: hypothetical protein M1431_07530 [Candidatus Thermoplasmatota archaeon]|nr:hypothetical protein [Candidatus Thermoplasmatota archaeon]